MGLCPSANPRDEQQGMQEQATWGRTRRRRRSRLTPGRSPVFFRPLPPLFETVPALRVERPFTVSRVERRQFERLADHRGGGVLLFGGGGGGVAPPSSPFL